MDFFTALAAGGVFDAGMRVDSGGPYFPNCSLNVLATKENVPRVFFPLGSVITNRAINLKQTEKHPRGDYPNSFIGFQIEEVAVARHNELSKTFDCGFDILVVIGVRLNHMDATTTFDRLRDQLDRCHP